jgi:DNA (cytosine-5)-methyltransferase 1
MEPLTVGSLFSGIGGIDLGLERAGMRVAWQSEIDPYANAVLRKHWPAIPNLGDIRTLDVFPAVDVVAGGFPCQPVSTAGRRLAQKDPRWLWPEFVRVVRYLRPRYAVVENVRGLLARGMGTVLGDLAYLGYDAEWASIPAAAAGAPHLRYRVFIVAYPFGVRLRLEPGRERRPSGSDPLFAEWDGQDRPVADASSARGQAGLSGPEQRQEGLPEILIDRSDRSLRRTGGDHWATEPDVGRVAHGVPSRVDRLRALGNAVVPQVAEWVGRQIVAYESARQEAALVR